MIAASLRSSLPRAPRMALGQQVRHNSTLPIPPKLATPSSVSGSSAPSASSSGAASGRMAEVVDFYKALPKGAKPGKKTNFENPGNGKPLVAGIAVLFLIGYTIDYQMHLKHHKNNAH